MSLLAGINILKPFVDKGLGIIDQFVTDKDKANELKVAFETELSKMDYSYLEKEIESRASIINAEAMGKSALQRNWRPITMLVFVYIVAHNYIIAPILGMFIDDMVVLEIPPDLWDLLKLGIGGYIAGRTGEKMIKTWKGR